MTNIIPFPSRPADLNRLALIGEHLRDSFAPPARDRELALLTQMAENLLRNLTEHEVDRFLVRLDAWEAENRA